MVATSEQERMYEELHLLDDLFGLPKKPSQPHCRRTETA